MTRQEQMLCNYDNARAKGYDYIFDVYKNPSNAKINAFFKYRNEYSNDKNAKGFVITGYNCDTFSVAWLTLVNDELTLVYQTAFKRHMVKVPNNHYVCKWYVRCTRQ